MSTLSLRKIKHDSSSIDNITLDSNGNVGFNTASVPNYGTSFTGVQVNGSAFGFVQAKGGTTIAEVMATTGYGYVGTRTNDPLVLRTYDTERVRIDIAGRVTMPYQPAFMVAGDSRSGYGPGTDFVYATTRFNVGNHYSTSTGRFTAPIAGRYAFYANTMGDSTDARLMIRIVINGTDYHQGSSSSNGSQYQDSKLFVLAQLNAGDYVYVRNVGNKSTYTFNELEQWFCGYLVS